MITSQFARGSCGAAGCAARRRKLSPSPLRDPQTHPQSIVGVLDVTLLVEVLGNAQDALLQVVLLPVHTKAWNINVTSLSSLCLPGCEEPPVGCG